MKTTTLAIIAALAFLFQMRAQTFNKEVIIDGQAPYLLGKIDKHGLESNNYQSWFSTNFEDYNVNDTIISSIAPELKHYDIIVFMGTWCGDSKQNVPKLYKVLEACNFPMDQLTVVAVSRAPNLYKQSPQHEEAGLNIHRVPTIIFFKDGKEVNRIVEYPMHSFEEDIEQIITNTNYKPNYHIVTIVNDILEEKGVKGLLGKQKKLVKQYKEIVQHRFELNTYGSILYNKNRTEEAIAVYRLNTKLFPEEPRTFMSLANTLGATNRKVDAIQVLEQALKLHPENSDLIENLEVIKSN
ncbi:thioredoxin family protein [Winogradskyella sediminis]|uniref:thioredoxin family protein n=1 Tax=Winogradskyella sediminis TaxID=1382466 RepID=UPI003AA831BD